MEVLPGAVRLTDRQDEWEGQEGSGFSSLGAAPSLQS